MARSLRIEFPGAFYHVTSRGNEQRGDFQERARSGEVPRLSESPEGDRHLFLLIDFAGEGQATF
jgi:hypothetical protein